MPSLELPVSLAALATGSGSMAVAAFLALKYRTPQLRDFLVLDSALFLMSCAFACKGFAHILLAIAPSSRLESSARRAAADLVAGAGIAQILGATMLTLALPSFTQGLFDRRPAAWYKAIGLGSGLAMAALGLAYCLGFVGEPGADLGSILIFANAALAIVLALPRLRDALPGARRREGERPPDLMRRGAGLFTAFLAVSACFLPLFVLDAFVLGKPEASAFAFLDNTTVPFYFILLNLGGLALARRTFDHPPLMDEDKVTEYGKQAYGLTEREAEVLEYIIDGYSLKDLAGVLGIAPKTAENHLQSVYRKTGVSNRIQLFQAFQNQRRSK